MRLKRCVSVGPDVGHRPALDLGFGRGVGRDPGFDVACLVMVLVLVLDVFFLARIQSPNVFQGTDYVGCNVQKSELCDSCLKPGNCKKLI